MMITKSSFYSRLNVTVQVNLIIIIKHDVNIFLTCFLRKLTSLINSQSYETLDMQAWYNSQLDIDSLVAYLCMYALFLCKVLNTVADMSLPGENHEVIFLDNGSRTVKGKLTMMLNIISVYTFSVTIFWVLTLCS